MNTNHIQIDSKAEGQQQTTIHFGGDSRCWWCTTFRHRHGRQASLIETAEIEESKAKVYKKDEEAIREKSGPERQLLLVIRRLDLAEKQEDARTCPKVRQAWEKVGGRRNQAPCTGYVGYPF